MRKELINKKIEGQMIGKKEKKGLIFKKQDVDSINDFIVIFSLTFILIFILLTPQISAGYTKTSNYDTLGGSLTSSFFGSTAGQFDRSMCEAGQDFVLQIAPAGCTPAVVRSDLLEEQNVPVYCAISATQINPLIEVNAIDYITFSGQTPKEVSGVGFHPNQGALGTGRSSTLDNYPVLENIGYAVIVLKQQSNESAMPDYVEGNLTAKIRYDIENAFGIGQATYYLPLMTDKQFNDKYKSYGFWNGRGYLRAESITKDSASISIYSGDGNSRQTVSLAEGKTSEKIYMTGFDYCLANMELKLDDIAYPDTRAKIRVNADSYEVATNEEFLEGKCEVLDMEKYGITERVKLKCDEDENSGLFGSNAFWLSITPKIDLEVNGEIKSVGLGDYVGKASDGRGIYVGYVGSVDDTKKIDSIKIFFVTKDTITDKLDDATVKEISTKLGPLYEKSTSKDDAIKFFSDASSSIAAWVYSGVRFVVTGQDIDGLFYQDGEQDIQGLKIKIKGTTGAVDVKLDEETQRTYNKAMADYDEVLSSFASENYKNINLGADAFSQKIYLAEQMQQKKTMADLCKEFNEAYPNENIPADCSDEIKLSSDVSSTKSVMINGKVKQISFDGIYKPSLNEYSIVGYARKTGDTSSAPISISLRKDEIKYFDAITDNSQYIFSVNQGIFTSSLYFKYQNNLWMWSPDKTNWMNVPATIVKGGSYDGKEPVQSNIDLIKSLEKKNFDDGKKLILNAGGESSSSGEVEYIQLGEIKDEENVNILTTGDIKSLGAPKTVSFKKGVPQIIGKYEITISQINLQRVAKVSVIPNIDYSGTETTFSFKIGIEKRNDLLKLSPEQAKDKINSLANTINQLEKISSNLGNIVKGLKTACLATGALFTVENLLSNLDGKGIARQKVMRDSGGWYNKCDALVSQGKYSTKQECLFDNSDKIDEDVDRYYGVLSSQNNEIEGMQKTINDGGLFSEDVINTTALLKDYSAKVQIDLSSCVGTEITNPSKSSETIKIDEVKSALSFDIWNTNKNYDFEELRDIGFYCDILKETPTDTAAKQKLYSLLADLKINTGDFVKRDSFLSKYGLSQGEGGFISTRKDITNIEFSSLKTWKDVKGRFTNVIASVPETALAFKGRNTIDFSPKDKEYVYFVTDVSNNKEYMLVLSDSYVVDRTFEISGSTLVILTEKVNPLGLSFKKVTSSSYANKYNNPEVKYFETAPFKGYPALVPIDIQKGWYVAMKQTLSVGGNIQTYDESGRVYSYYLGNTGENGNVDFFEGGGDDIYQMVVLGSKETYTKFSGLSETEVLNLVKRAEEAISSAQKQYSSGVQKVNVPGVGVVKVGTPSVSTSEIECEDIMSPKQCQILFNVCDPVICPSSRCDLGGAYPVADVIQSGVIGSIALCFPNYREGIYIPVCLTGVKAGLDNWISIQKSYRDCLQEQLETGETVGICDEIQSIYACEFFWRQSLPLAKIVIPTIFSTILGQNVRGGGEYLGVASAWDNAEKSVDYFTQYYADDSFKAFKARSTDEVGGEVCKSFVSGVYPSSGNLLDSLTEPDSPPQFTGRFDEISLTTVTNPPTSQYKVFYHIYAGTDSGAYFRVYLKGSSGSSYYQDTALSRIVDYGYIEKGGYKSETVDFTAPSGYSQLCILVNGQEECGFKQVSTDFAVNYVQDEYLSEQATSNVTSESECISGTPSIYSMLSPNLQEAVSSTINPELYNQGIYRICATNNPGQGTDSAIGTEDQRWVEVGYCGDKNLKCWLDMQSVKSVIKNLNIENDTVQSINEQVQANLEATGNSSNLADILTQLENENDNNKKINIINDVIGNFFFNYQKGKLLIERGKAFGNLALGLFKEKNDAKIVDSEDKTTTDTTTPTEAVQEQSQEISKIGTTTTSSDGISITYLIFEFESGGFLGIAKSSIYYSYSGNNWFWSLDKKEWYTLANAAFAGMKTGEGSTEVLVIPELSQENKDFALSLTDKTLSEGVSALLTRTKSNEESGLLSNVELSTEKAVLSHEGLFTIDRGFSSNNLYFKYESNVWKWATTGKFYSVSEIPSTYTEEGVSGGQMLTTDNVNLIKSLNGKNYIDGALLVFGVYNPSTIPSTSGTSVSLTCTNQKECQIALGKEIITIAKQIKQEKKISDNLVKEQTGAKNFECLVLQLAYQESKINQCGEIISGVIAGFHKNGDPLYCNGNLNEVLKSSGDEKSYGVMQINIGANPTANADDFNENVKFGINLLVDGYNIDSKTFTCTTKSYTGWTRAIRNYNGWGCTGDNNYVENVIGNKDEIEALFPETCK